MITATVLADTVVRDGRRITTFEVVFPRPYLAEINTHRIISKNSASSRAIPVEKMIEKVRTDPYIPLHFGKKQKGMQADQQIPDAEIPAAIQDWLWCRDLALLGAQKMLDRKLHKQLVNRVIEPYAWHTVVFTSTFYRNFYRLRDSPLAQPEVQMLARAMREAHLASTPRVVDSLAQGDGDVLAANLERVGLLKPRIDDLFSPETLRTLWNAAHLPFVRREEIEEDLYVNWALISAGRSARVSYLTHLGVRDLADDIRMAKDLVGNRHMSPLEHPAFPGLGVKSGNKEDWLHLRSLVATESGDMKLPNDLEMPWETYSERWPRGA